MEKLKEKLRFFYQAHGVASLNRHINEELDYATFKKLKDSYSCDIVKALLEEWKVTKPKESGVVDCIFNFAKMLREHNWGYKSSEDPIIYDKGREERDAIKRFMKTHSPIADTLDMMYNVSNPETNGES